MLGIFYLRTGGVMPPYLIATQGRGNPAPTNSFRNNSMYTFANKENLCDLHVAKIRFGGDVLLKPGTERFTEEIPEDSKDQCKGNEQEAPTGGSGSSKRCPGKGRRKKRGGDEIGSTSRVDS